MYAIRPSRTGPAPPNSAESGYFDNRFGATALKVLPGEFRVASDDVMLVTVLGSCVSACIHDPLTGVGGMNHFMLPENDKEAGRSSWASESARYGSYAMEMLINELLKQGAERQRLVAKLFGGGAVLSGLTTCNVGQRNGEFALRYLQAEQIKLSASDLFDVFPRRVHYFPQSGRVMVKRLASARDADVIKSEKLYSTRLHSSPTLGSVELF